MSSRIVHVNTTSDLERIILTENVYKQVSVHSRVFKNEENIEKLLKKKNLKIVKTKFINQPITQLKPRLIFMDRVMEENKSVNWNESSLMQKVTKDQRKHIFMPLVCLSTTLTSLNLNFSKHMPGNMLILILRVSKDFKKLEILSMELEQPSRHDIFHFVSCMATQHQGKHLKRLQIIKCQNKQQIPFPDRSLNSKEVMKFVKPMFKSNHVNFKIMSKYFIRSCKTKERRILFRTVYHKSDEDISLKQNLYETNYIEDMGLIRPNLVKLEKKKREELKKEEEWKQILPLLLHMCGNCRKKGCPHCWKYHDKN